MDLGSMTYFMIMYGLIMIMFGMLLGEILRIRLERKEKERNRVEELRRKLKAIIENVWMIDDKLGMPRFVVGDL